MAVQWQLEEEEQQQLMMPQQGAVAAVAVERREAPLELELVRVELLEQAQQEDPVQQVA